MNLFIRVFAMATLILVGAAQTHAGPMSGVKPSAGKTVTAPKTTTFAKTTTTKTITASAKTKIPTQGVKFANGFLYKGKNYLHWEPDPLDVRYGCYCYWDPCMLRWYYWCEQCDCYYPVSYCPYRTYCHVGVVEVAAPATHP